MRGSVPPTGHLPDLAGTHVDAFTTIRTVTRQLLRERSAVSCIKTFGRLYSSVDLSGL